ncbi:MAG: phosphoribosylformylglycinamidine synthase I [Polyangiales bacterium]
MPTGDERGTSPPKKEAVLQIAVIQFPGSNADWDALHVARDVLGADARYVFHKEKELGPADAVVIPGGFSYGDYLRPGAIARFSPITEALVSFAKAGGPILGICNGFQILTELQLLPGALTRNAHLRFECRDIHLRPEGKGAFTDAISSGAPLRMPIAHADGRYQCDAQTLQELEDNGRVAFRYCDAAGHVPTDDNARDASGLRINPNGSLGAIAGVYDAGGRVLGMMPHPERASEAVLGGREKRADGLSIFLSLKAHLEGEGQ